MNNIKAKIFSEYLHRTFSIALTFGIGLLFIQFFILDFGRVNGQSMFPTYDDADVFLVNKGVYLIVPPKRYDVVQLFSPQDESTRLIKRVIGTPGETVIIKENGISVITVEGEEIRLEEDYLPVGTITQVRYGQQSVIEVPEDHYFVVGDNRLFSAQDSRGFGSVHRRLITGKATPALEFLSR